MNKTRSSLILFVILALFTLFIGTTSAQDIDVSTMSDEEIMVLLQSILQKLDQETAADTEETAVPASTEPAAGAPEPTPIPETFTVYENKKLQVENLPAYWFIRKPTVTEEDDDTNNNDSNGGGTIFHYGGTDYYPVYGMSYNPPDVWVVW